MMNQLRAAKNALPLVLTVLTWATLCGSGYSQNAPVPANRPAHYPPWWFKWSVVPRLNPANSNPIWPTDYPPADDFAAPNLGQLKYLAKQAAAELEQNLPGGSGAAVQEVVANLEMVNLALEAGVSATQSSTGWDAPATRAIDGNTDGNFQNNSVSHTYPDATAWWQVNLGSSRTIRNVEIWNRTDCCGSRNANFYIFVSSTDMSGRTLASLLADATVWKSPKITSYPNPNVTIPVGSQTGRYVMMRLQATECLSLAEVRVNGSRAAGSGALDDFSAANIGQLKAIAKPYYDRLIAVGYTSAYPWSGQSADDYLAPNLGQLKHVFSFDVTRDSNGSGIPDWQESGANPGADPDEDGLTNAEEIALGTNPYKKDNPSVQLSAFGYTAP